MDKIFIILITTIVIGFGAIIYNTLDKHQEMKIRNMKTCSSKGGVLVVDTSQGSMVRTWCVKKEVLLR